MVPRLDEGAIDRGSGREATATSMDPSIGQVGVCVGLAAAGGPPAVRCRSSAAAVPTTTSSIAIGGASLDYGTDTRTRSGGKRSSRLPTRSCRPEERGGRPLDDGVTSRASIAVPRRRRGAYTSSYIGLRVARACG